MNDFGSMALTAAAVSLVVSIIKKYSGVSGTKANALAIGVAVVGGAVYTLFKDTTYWTTFLQVLGFANVIYMLLVQHIDNQIKTVVDSIK